MKSQTLLEKVFSCFRPANNTAKSAKERLQIIISHERGQRDKPDYLIAMQRDLLDVIAKYVPIDKEAVKVDLERKDGCSVLELNVVLPHA
jgi:cell division topological specificity factor